MSTLIIPDIEVLRTVVKINASLPWESITPYLNDARDIYLSRYLGEELIERIETGDADELLPLTIRTLGPLTIMLAAPEMGISIGDSGITVQNDQTKRSPANEAKIAAAVKSFQFRGFQAMDRLLSYLEKHKETYPEWTNSRYCTLHTGGFINDATTFQDVGLVDIDYSILAFHTLFSTLWQIQLRHVRELLGDTLYQSLLEKRDFSPKERILIDHSIRYLANKTAEIYTSQTSRQQRTGPERPEYTPIIRPLYTDQADTGNFFADQAAYFAGVISNYLQQNAEDLGISQEVHKVDWNEKKKKLFTSIS